GKYLVGTTVLSQGKSGESRLILWEISSGQSRLLDNNGQPHLVRQTFSMPMGSFDLVSTRLDAVAFPDDGDPFLFAQYGADVIAAWAMKSGKPLDTQAFGIWPHLEQRDLRVRGCLVPGSPADRYRFR